MHRSYIGVGSNIGDARANVEKAYQALAEAKGVRRARLSPLFRTAPVGYLDQDWFVNAVVELFVDFDGMELFSLCQSIEMKMKRIREERWGPRIIDLDVLWIDGVTIDEDDLKIPHARAHERAFVLKPLACFDSELILHGRSVLDWLHKCDDQELEECV